MQLREGEKDAKIEAICYGVAGILTLIGFIGLFPSLRNYNRYRSVKEKVGNFLRETFQRRHQSNAFSKLQQLCFPLHSRAKAPLHFAALLQFSQDHHLETVELTAFYQSYQRKKQQYLGSKNSPDKS